ncbi:Lrp/AsnC family transcriptional regulator [Galactobacillus timonensis]|uniref:Lrp/AsnC family transcriptional regulator n=1 Tax=Galactobacillus timonensis TaxID=2041840 RepID=UPI002409D0CC|nr:Lrp/AsnC family transcriptional regulator [Galactobacillus timonensis]MDD6681201.1 Lrp/AsnC family transcriptional regulator [Galactobacillus timonensis]
MDTLQLLKALEQNPRISTADLADVLNTSVEQVEAEKDHLEKTHVICGYHTVINWDRTNTDRVSAIIEVSGKPERDVGYDKIAQRIARFDEVTSLYLMSGNSEFMVFVEGQTMREIADFVGQKLAPIDGVTSTVTCFLLKKYKVEGVMMESEELKDERQLITA